MPQTPPFASRRGRATHALHLANLAIIGCGLAFSTLTLGPAAARAQAPDTLLWVANNAVDAVAQYGNTLYIGGTFTTVGRYTGGGAILDLPTGFPTARFPRVTGNVYCVAPDGSGGWIIGGVFTAVGSLPRSNIARILADGTISAWNANANGEVDAILVVGSTVYVGGNFTQIGGQTRNHIAALDVSSGLAVFGWDPNASAAVYALALNGSTLYMGGAFNTVSGVARVGGAAVNINTAALTSWSPGANNIVRSLAILGSRIYVGGYFSSIGGQSLNRLASLDLVNGLADPNWNPNGNNVVFALAASASTNTVYAAGVFTTIGGQTRNRIAALDLETGAATVWNPNPNGAVYSLVLNGATIYAAGAFSQIGGQTRNRIVQLDTTSTSPNATAWNPNASFTVDAIAINGNQMYAGGEFTTIGTQTRNRIAALDLTTGALTAWDPNSNSTVFALAANGSTVYVGGAFTTIGGQARNRIAALDPVTGNAVFSWNPNSNNIVYTLALGGPTLAGPLYAGGGFTNIGGQTRNRLAQLEPAGGTATGVASTWNPNANNIVYALAVDGQTVVAGGGFGTIGGAAHSGLVALDATTGAVAPWDGLSNNTVYAVGIRGGMIYAGGVFTSIGGQARNYLAQVDATTGAVTAWNPSANNFVYALTLGNTAVYVGGVFTFVGGQTRNHIASLDPVAANGAATAWDPNVNSTVEALAINKGEVYLGGGFTTVGGLNDYYIGGVIADRAYVGVPVAQTDTRFGLFGAPNPTSAQTELRFALPTAGPVSLEVFDLAGRRVSTLIDHQTLAAGPHFATFATQGVSTGLYFARLEFGSQVAMRRLEVIR